MARPARVRMRRRKPWSNDKRIDEESGERKRFSSAILPAWARKSPKVAEVLPLLYCMNAPHLVALVRAGARS